MPVVRPVRSPRRASPGHRILTLTEFLIKLGIELDAQLFELALTHRSFAYENGGIDNNERLEFLGDSVLGMVVTADLYRGYPDLPEGRLAKLRAAVVNTHALADVARELGVGPLIRLGVGETRDHGSDKASILADTMESLIGAIYMQHGIGAAESFVRHLFRPKISQAVAAGAGIDWKSSLQDLCAGRHVTVQYESTESGPDHAKQFEAHVVVGGERFGPGSSTTKRHAEQQAAELAYRALSERP